MSKYPRWKLILNVLKVLAIPLVIFLAFDGCPWLRTSLMSACQNHPVAAPVTLGILCFLAGPLLFSRNRSPGAEHKDQHRDIGIILLILFVAVGAGIWLIGASTVFALENMRAAAFRAISMWAFAYFALGFFAGFLFGIPRVLQSHELASKAAPGATTGYTQQVNTNLEQISDWLTKIIVGLGLVQLKQVPRYLKEAATWVAQTISPDHPSVAGLAAPNAAVVSYAGSIIVFFSITGFLAGYLITRLFLAGAFGRADTRRIENAFSDEQMATRIRTFLRPNGILDAKATQSAGDWMKANGLENRMITELIAAHELQWARQKIVADLNIP